MSIINQFMKEINDLIKKNIELKKEIKTIKESAQRQYNAMIDKIREKNQEFELLKEKIPNFVNPILKRIEAMKKTDKIIDFLVDIHDHINNDSLLRQLLFTPSRLYK